MKSPARTAGEYGDFGVGTPGGMILSIMFSFSSMAFRFKEALRFHRRHAAGARRRDRLAVGTILHVAGVKNSGDVSPRAAFGKNVAVGVGLDLTLEHGRVGDMPDGDEESVHLLLPNRAGRQVAQPRSADQVGGDIENIFYHGVEQELDLGVGADAVEHDFGRAKLIAAMHQR